MDFIWIKIFNDFSNIILLNEIFESVLFVFLKESVGSVLVFSTSVHCLAKKLLKIWAVSLKPVI